MIYLWFSSAGNGVECHRQDGENTRRWIYWFVDNKKMKKNASLSKKHIFYKRMKSGQWIMVDLIKWHQNVEWKHYLFNAFLGGIKTSVLAQQLMLTFRRDSGSFKIPFSFCCPCFHCFGSKQPQCCGWTIWMSLQGHNSVTNMQTPLKRQCWLNTSVGNWHSLPCLKHALYLNIIKFKIFFF